MCYNAYYEMKKKHEKLTKQEMSKYQQSSMGDRSSENFSIGKNLDDGMKNCRNLAQFALANDNNNNNGMNRADTSKRKSCGDKIASIGNVDQRKRAQETYIAQQHDKELVEPFDMEWRPTGKPPHFNGPCSDYINPDEVICKEAELESQIRCACRPLPHENPFPSKRETSAPCNNNNNCGSSGSCQQSQQNQGGCAYQQCFCYCGRSSASNGSSRCVRKPEDMSAKERECWTNRVRTLRRMETTLKTKGLIMGPKECFPEYFPPGFDPKNAGRR